MTDPLHELDTALREAQPELYSGLQPGTTVRFTTPLDLRHWFAWRNGQPTSDANQLFETHSFVDYQTACAELSHMRSTLWRSPLTFAILLLLNRRVFYTIPILTDVAGDGYCYDLLRRRPYYRFKGERDLPIKSFRSFLYFLTRYVRQKSVNSANDLEEAFIRELA